MHKFNRRIHERNKCTYKTILLLLPYYTIQHTNKIKVTAATTPHPHTSPPSSECQDLERESKALALALTSERLSLWYRMVVACDMLHPIWMARQAARLEKDCCASVPQHPYDSTARGMHTHPSSAHLGSLALCFLASATRAEDPNLTLASVKVAGLSGEVIVRSKAAGLPRCQLLTSTSAGRECSLSRPRPLPTST